VNRPTATFSVLVADELPPSTQVLTEGSKLDPHWRELEGRGIKSCPRARAFRTRFSVGASEVVNGRGKGILNRHYIVG
jgi:hypothetical protein